MSVSFTLTGDDIVLAMLRQARAVASGATGNADLEEAAKPLVEAWQADAPVDTGAYQNSIRVEPQDSQSVRVLSDVPYARRLEFGFSGADALGRVYHQPPGGYARRALDNTRDAVIRNYADAFAARIGAAR